MTGEPIVAVTYAAGEQDSRASTEVLGGDAEVVFLAGRPESERREVLRRASAVITSGTAAELPAGALDGADSPGFLQLMSAGVDHVDLSAIPERVRVAGNVGGYAPPIAEHVMAMTLALARRLAQQHAALAEGRWDQGETLLTLDGAVCAVLGFGGIGQATARLMRAFGARIHAVNSSGETSEPTEFTGTLDDLDKVLAAADVVVVALPLTRRTRGLIGARELGLMKPTAILVNVARGAVVDEQALYEHLLANPGFGAGLDVWWDEPRAGEKFRTRFPFTGLPNVIGTPHNSGTVPGMMDYAARNAAGNVLAYLRGGPVRGLVRRADYPAR